MRLSAARVVPFVVFAIAVCGLGVSFTAAAAGRGGLPVHVPVPVASLAPPAADGAGGLGHSVAVSGDTALVSAWASGLGGGSGGALYVFVRSGDVWTAQDAPLPGGGEDVALDGDTAVVGTGASALVFVRSGSAWTQQAELKPGAEGGWNDDFGAAVAVDGDTVAVGAPHWGPDVDSDAGTVYVYQRSGTTWSLQARVVAAGGGTYDQFGHDVAVAGDCLLVGAPERAIQKGAAYVFTRSGSIWSQQAELTLPGAAEQDGFGAALALSGDTALISAPGRTVAGKDCGAAYVFVRGASGWTRQARLLAGDPEVWDGFGVSVGIDGDLAVIGAPSHDVSYTVLGAGAAYAYWRTGSSWSLPVWLTAPDAQDNDRLCEDVAVSGGVAVTGAPWRAHAATDPSDHAYTFTPVRPPAPRLASLSRPAARRDSVIAISGRRFGAAPGFSYVRFGAEKVTHFRSWSAERITCKVPATARLGRIRVWVVTPGGTSLARVLVVKR